MVSSAKAPSGLFSSLFDIVIHVRPVSRTGSQSQSSGPSLEELTAHLAPHLLVDIGVLDVQTAALGAGSPTSQPLVPPVSAMHRRGNWHGQGGWSWPLRV